MKDLRSCVVESLDGTNDDIFPFLPYLLQDLTEIGADPDIVCTILRNNVKNIEHLKILDLGCGKGAIVVPLAREFGCSVVGIDAIPEFIESAVTYAFSNKVKKNVSLK